MAVTQCVGVPKACLKLLSPPKKGDDRGATVAIGGDFREGAREGDARERERDWTAQKGAVREICANDVCMERD